MNGITQQIRLRLRQLEASLDRALDNGADPDGYNIGWTEGAIHELGKLMPPGATPGDLVEHAGDWVCPACDLVIHPEELGCGCGGRRPQ